MIARALQAPFPYFGGKSRCADLVWRRFGVVDNYVEPFFGSGAVLLRRPDFDPECPPTETVNDKDAFLSNFWRALKAEPETLAEICDNPVNEVDLTAWHRHLVTASRKAELAERCANDPEYYDAVIAGRWCWGLCQWIGRGWCAGEWHGPGDELNAGDGINVRDPEHGGKRPHLRDAGQGVHRKLPHIFRGRGVHRKHPPRSDGEHPCSAWFAALAQRLRRVRVCCGDWSRVMGYTPTCANGLTAIFLDPPYSADAGRKKEIYNHEDLDVAHDVRAWCLENGANPLLRIALCGYEGEGHEELESRGWDVVSWKAHGGYGMQGKKKNGTEYVNKYRERVWFSPACVAAERVLF